MVVCLSGVGQDPCVSPRLSCGKSLGAAEVGTGASDLSPPQVVVRAYPLGWVYLWFWNAAQKT